MEYATSVSKKISRAKPIINKGRVEKLNKIIRHYFTIERRAL